MPDAPEGKVEYLQKLVAGQQEKESSVALNKEPATEDETVSTQIPTAPSRVLRRDGERPFFGSGIYERVSKAKKVWMEREERFGKVGEEGVRCKLELPQHGQSRKSPRPPRRTSAVGDWGIDIFQEIAKTMLETTEGDVDDGKKSVSGDVTAREEDSESEAEPHGGDGSRSVETRDMI